MSNSMKNKWNSRFESCPLSSIGALCCADLVWLKGSDFLLKCSTQKSIRVVSLHEEEHAFKYSNDHTYQTNA